MNKERFVAANVMALVTHGLVSFYDSLKQLGLYDLHWQDYFLEREI